MADLRVVALIPAKPGRRTSSGRPSTPSPRPAGATRAASGSEVLRGAVAAPGTFVTLETWQSQQDLDAHMQTPDIAAALGAVGERLGGEIAIHPLTGV